MAKQIFRILDDFSFSEMKLRNIPRKPNGLYNMHLNEYGQLVKRAGYSEYNTTVIGEGSHKIVGMHRFYNFAMKKEFIVAWNTSLYKLADTSPYGATALTGCPTLEADSDTHFFDFYNHCFILNGEDSMMKYDRSNVRIAGVDPPDAAPTGTSPATGNLSEGDYGVCYTYVDEDSKEGNASATVTIAASADDKIELAIVVSEDPKVTKRRIYRTVADGAIYYFDKEVDNNEDISVDLTQADSTLGQGTVLHTDHTAPPDALHLGTKRRSRAYIAKDDIVYISNLTEPEYFPLVTGQYIWTGNRQKVTGMLEQLTGLPVFTDDSIERLLGTDRKNFSFKNSYATEGNIAIRSLVNCDNFLVYLEFDGIHYFDGVSTDVFSEALNEYIKANINRTYAHLSCATYYDNKYLLCYPKGDSTTPSETIYVDLKNRTFGIYSFSFSCFSRWSRGTDGLRLFGGSNTIGRVYEIFKATGTDILTDDESAIEAYDQTEYIDFGIPEREKNIFEIYVRCESTTATTLTVYYQTDMNTEASVTDTLEASKDQWYKLRLPSGVRGRGLKIRPRVNDKYAVTFKGYMIQFNVEELRV